MPPPLASSLLLNTYDRQVVVREARDHVEESRPAAGVTDHPTIVPSPDLPGEAVVVLSRVGHLFRGGAGDERVCVKRTGPDPRWRPSAPTSGNRVVPPSSLADVPNFVLESEGAIRVLRSCVEQTANVDMR